jgi:hypothetical protein
MPPAKKPRAPKAPPESRMTTISISAPPEMRDQIDARAIEMGLSRSQYVVKLMLRDLVKAGLINEEEWFEKMAERKRR